MSRTPVEIREVVCNIVRFYRQDRPTDLVTPVVCISAVPDYKEKAKTLLESLRNHHQSIPIFISRGTEIRQITTQIATTGRKIRDSMRELIDEFLEKEG